MEIGTWSAVQKQVCGGRGGCTLDAQDESWLQQKKLRRGFGITELQGVKAGLSEIGGTVDIRKLGPGTELKTNQVFERPVWVVCEHRADKQATFNGCLNWRHTTTCRSTTKNREMETRRRRRTRWSKAGQMAAGARAQREAKLISTPLQLSSKSASNHPAHSIITVF